jgi:hypothetical protein
LILLLWEASIGGSVEYFRLVGWSHPAISIEPPDSTLFKWQEKAKMALKLINWGNKKGLLIEITRPF